MSFGLRVWDAAGNVALDIGDRVMRYISSHSYTIPTNSTSISISVPGMVNDGTWVVVPAGIEIHHWAVVGSNLFTMARLGDQGNESSIALVFRY